MARDAAPALDVVLAVLVLEHVGRDNSVYPAISARDRRPRDGDQCSVRELARLLAPGGRLIVTVP
jgi:hypothetical protein